MFWYEKEALKTTPVISTRVRFARNLSGIPFPHRLSEEEKEKVWEKIRKAYEGKDVFSVPFSSLDPLEKRAYVETRLASPELSEKGKGSGLILSRDGSFSLMVNEEDHLRLQVISSGKEIRKTFESALEWIGYGEEKLSFAYREKLGYLTSCPTNLGAAMRISVMIHLPALTSMGSMPRLVRRLNDAGFTVRGLFGENSAEGGGIYQISNQMSREKTPEEIVSSFEAMILQVEDAEGKAGQQKRESDPVAVLDRVCRSLGILKYAKKMSYGEFLSHYSVIRFGKVLGMKELEGITGLDRYLVELMPAPMQLLDRNLTESQARDIRRSEKLREVFREKGGNEDAS